MKKISVGVADFALPVPRCGSIDSNTGLGRSQQLGQEIHQKIQLSRSLAYQNYDSEITIAHEFSSEPYVFKLHGRMDGFFAAEDENSLPMIEEIKSTFNIHDLFRALQETEDHPYILQVKTYGYLFWLKNKIFPKIRLYLVSTRNGDTLDYDVSVDLDRYQNWFDRRLQELVEEVRLDEKRVQRRKKAAKALTFPFAEPRPGQVELIETIEHGMAQNQPMLLQAPTGLGKTVGVLYPTMKEALERGQKVIYVTPKNSQHAVAEDAVSRLHEAGANLKSITITAKSKICMKNEAYCNPEYCEFAKDHYTKVAENKIPELLAKKKSLTTRTFKKLAEDYQVCPFELQFDAARDADTVICDYNYVFAPRAATGSLTQNGWAQTGKPNLVIDEAHNLPARALDYFSPSLSCAHLEKMKEETGPLILRFREKTIKLIDRCIEMIKGVAVAGETKSHAVSPPLDSFLDMDAELKAFLSTYLSADVEIQPRDVVMRLSFYWSEFTEALQYMQLRELYTDSTKSKFFTTFTPHPPTLKITCCDASDMLKDTYENFAQVVAFSATLKPFDFYSRLAGLHEKNLKTAEFVSPFPKANRKVLIIPQISSKYSERARSYPRVADAIAKITALRRGNYVVFFPSFEFLEQVFSRCQVNDDWQLLKQERAMKRDDVENVLERLKDQDHAHILFAVQGGIFSEGVDYPGHMLIGAFVVGPPLPHFDLEREKMREYYDEQYSAGFDYAYTFPAMAKAVQAAGRVIRSESDKGIIVLMDNRFVHPSYTKSMPSDWFDEDVRELVSQQILRDVEQFWRDAE